MQTEIYDQVTNTIIRKLESGIVPWVKPWSGDASGADVKLSDGTPYQGINRLILGMQGRDSNLWGSFKQWQEKGAHVRKGESGTKIVFYSPVIKENKDTGESESYAVLKTYTVFNADQVEGYTPPATEKPVREINPAPALDRLIANTGAKIDHGGNRAFYRHSDDQIRMPVRESFKTDSHYYATLLHELTHWTGADSRLARGKGNLFGSPEYAFEELVAEMGAAFLCHDHGIKGELQHADYIGNWLECLKNDKRAVFKAAALAQKAADYLKKAA